MDIRNFFGAKGVSRGGNDKNTSTKPDKKPVKTPAKSQNKRKTSVKATSKAKTPVKAETDVKSPVKSPIAKSQVKVLEKTKSPVKILEKTKSPVKILEKTKSPVKITEKKKASGKLTESDNCAQKDTENINTKPSSRTSRDKSKDSRRKSKENKKRIDSDPDIEIIDSDNDDFETKNKNKKNKNIDNNRSIDKNANIRKSKIFSSGEDEQPPTKKEKPKKAFILESSDDEDVAKKSKKQSVKPKRGVIFDSDSEEDEDPLPNKTKSRSRSKKRDISIFDSDEENKQRSIEEAFQMSSKKSHPKPRAPETPKSKTPPKKVISAADFFGTGSVQRRDTKTSTLKRKAELSPVKNGDPDFEIHDDSDFEETLQLIDEKDGHQDKKPRLQEETTESKSLASKLSEKVRAGIRVEETPDKSKGSKTVIAPTKTSPGKATPGRAMPKNSPVKISPAKSPVASTSPGSKVAEKTSPDKPELQRKNTGGFRNYLNREGPRSLGSKEIPQGGENCLEGLTFVITGVLESFERDEAKSLIERYGGKVTGSLSKKTSYIIWGRDAGESKTAKAQQLGTKQLDEDALLKLIKTLPGKKSKYEIEAEKQASKNTPGKRKLSSATRKEEPLVKKTVHDSVMASPISRSLPATPKVSRIPSTPTGAASVGSSPISVSKGSTDSQESLLWVDKYKPTCLKQIIGQQGDRSNAKKLINWLKMWHKNVTSGKKPAFNRFSDDGSGFRCALLSGPPGVGKTTTAHLVCKEANFTFVELNASDTRSKKSLQQEVSEALSNQSLAGYFGTSSAKTTDSHSHCLVMDEVDGMAGNEDRGGMQELITLIKNTKIPIICMCNDRNHQKIRSLANHCFDLRFQRPRVEQIKSAMMSLAFKEGVKIPPAALNEIILASNQDVRQVIHNLSMWSVDEKNLTYDQLKKDAAKAKKDIKLGPFDVLRKVFVGGEETANMTINDKSDLFFHDYSFGPLFVQENYITVQPYAGRGDTKNHLKLLSRAADSIAAGDMVDRLVRGKQNWSMLPLQAIFASVIPGDTMRGNLGGQIAFPSWLGKNSTQGKNDRILQELKSHMRLQISGDKRGLNLEYLPHFRNCLTRPLVEQGAEGIPEIIETLDKYDLIKEDFDSILEVSQWPNSSDPMSKVEPKVKAAFTRTYNKEVHLTPYATGNVAKKGRKRGGGGGDQDELEGEGEGRVSASEEEEEDVAVDSMVKQKKKPAAAAKGRGASANKDKGSAKGGPSKGRGRGKGRGK